MTHLIGVDVGASHIESAFAINWAWSASRPEVAAAARTVLQEAESGDEVAAGIVRAAAHDLAHLVVTLASRCSDQAEFGVAFSGRLLSADSPVRGELAAVISSELPGTRIVEKTVDPAVGALSITYKLLKV